MIIAFQILLMLVIIVSFCYIVSDEESSKENKLNLTLICLSSIAAFVLSGVLL